MQYDNQVMYYDNQVMFYDNHTCTMITRSSRWYDTVCMIITPYMNDDITYMYNDIHTCMILPIYEWWHPYMYEWYTRLCTMIDRYVMITKICMISRSLGWEFDIYVFTFIHVFGHKMKTNHAQNLSKPILESRMILIGGDVQVFS